MAVAASAATFGTVVPIGGMASDLALDESRGVVYVANYTANRIDVVSMATRSIQTSIPVAAQPAAVTLSPDGQYLVVTHLANFKPPQTPANKLSILKLTKDLAGITTRTLTPAAPPMAVSFGANGKALLVTTTDFLLLDPVTATTSEISTILDVAAKQLPVPTPTTPREIIQASSSASGDLSTIWGTVEMKSTDNLELIFQYNVKTNTVLSAAWQSSPTDGPRAVSVNKTGSNMLVGWGSYDANGVLIAQFADPLGKFEVGSHAIDSTRNLIYAQVPNSKWNKSTPPTLMVVDADNLALRETFQLKENLSGRSLLDSAGNVMYSVSVSGLSILPVGSLNQIPQILADKEDVVFRGQWCDRRTGVQTINITDPSGQKADFALSTTMPGVTFSPASGKAPATVQVSVDMSTLQSKYGTASAPITITSSAAVNVPKSVRILVNNHKPEQRGTFFNVPGTLVDVLADPVRDRFYILRQDQNQVLVFDSTNYTQVATLRTGNTPWSMTITNDNKYLIIGADNSQIAHVYDLDTLQLFKHIVYPGGHYPRAVAASKNAILTACRVAGPTHTIDRVNLKAGLATTPASLGVWTNSININTAALASPSGSKVFFAEADGTMLLYDAAVDSFVSAVQPADSLSGAVAALADNLFVADNFVVNESLGVQQMLDKTAGSSSGVALTGGVGVQTNAPDSASPGVIRRVDLNSGVSATPLKMTEAPLLANGQSGAAFIRGMVSIPKTGAFVSLSTSGFTALASNYDAAATAPQISSIVSAADKSSSVAAGGLFTLNGKYMSTVSAGSNAIPLPTVLGDSCLTINDSFLVPLTLVSPSQINGQVPFEASSGTLVLHTPAGDSNSLTLDISSPAPSVFWATVPGWSSQMPMVYRALNNEVVTPSNPVHPKDTLLIYVTGLGPVSPAVASGSAPGSQPSTAIAAPEVFLGGVNLPIVSAALTSGQVGVYEIKALVPFKGVPTGMSIPLTVVSGTKQATVSVRVAK